MNLYFKNAILEEFKLHTDGKVYFLKKPTILKRKYFDELPEEEKSNYIVTDNIVYKKEIVDTSIDELILYTSVQQARDISIIKKKQLLGSYWLFL